MSPFATVGHSSSLAITPTWGAGFGVATVTAGGSAHTKGGWAALESTVGNKTPFDVHGFLFIIDGNQTDVDELTDIGIGPSGSQVPIVDNILTGSPDDFIAVQKGYFPLFIPRNTQVWARTQMSTASLTNLCGVVYFGKSHYSTPVFRRCVTFGADTSATSGTEMNPTLANTLTAWQTLGLPVPHRLRAMSIWLKPTVAAMFDHNHILDVGVLPKGGTAGTDEILQQRLLFTSETGNDIIAPRTVGPFPINAQEGDSIRTRGQATTNQPYGSIIHVCYGFG